MYEYNDALPDGWPEDTVLWRYMDPARFLDLIQTSELNFAPAFKMDDPWEGAYGPVNRASWPTLYGEHYASIKAQFNAGTENMRKRTFLNCWNASPYESAALWSIYDREGRGVAIRTTKRKLLGSLNGSELKVTGFPVTYLDYMNQGFDDSKNVFTPYMHKRISFDPLVRSRAAGMVAFGGRPGALEVLLPLADDPVPHVRIVLGWYLGGLRDRAAEPALRGLLADPNEQVRTFAARGLARLNRQ